MTWRPHGGRRREAARHAAQRAGTAAAGRASSSSPGCPGRASRRRSARSRISATTASTTCRCRCCRSWPSSLRAGPRQRVAVVVDVRERALHPASFRASIKRLKTMPPAPMLIFLEATTPSWCGASARRGGRIRSRRIGRCRRAREERASLRSAHGRQIIDTSAINVHELRQVFSDGRADAQPGSKLVVTVLSFGFKHGLPVEADLVFDVRFLPNPHFVPRLRPKTGRTARSAFLDSHAPRRVPRHTLTCVPAAAEGISDVSPRYVTEEKDYLTTAIGRTGGRHRSVYRPMARLTCEDWRAASRARARLSRHRDLVKAPA